LKPARLRPSARDDRREAVRYYRQNASIDVARRFIGAMKSALYTVQAQPGIGSPGFGVELGIEGLRSWAVSGFALVLFYFERANHLDVVRMLGQREDIATILTGEP
jgi:toxin ParE1/3/4